MPQQSSSVSPQSSSVPSTSFTGRGLHSVLVRPSPSNSPQLEKAKMADAYLMCPQLVDDAPPELICPAMELAAQWRMRCRELVQESNELVLKRELSRIDESVSRVDREGAVFRPKGELVLLVSKRRSRPFKSLASALLLHFPAVCANQVCEK